MDIQQLEETGAQAAMARLLAALPEEILLETATAEMLILQEKTTGQV